MNWEAIGAVGEIVGATAVVLSLLYLASQIRQSTKTARASSRQVVLDRFTDAGWELGKHPHLQRIAVVGLNNFDSLSDDEKTTFDLVMGKYAGNVYNALLLRNAGMLDEETLEVVGNLFLTSVATPGGLQWWQTARKLLYPELRSYVDDRVSASDAPPSFLESNPLWRRNSKESA